jgi:3-oxoacyl-[acyl-carrier-protein] synthase II
MHAACNNLTIAAKKDFSRVSPFFIPHLIPNMAGAMAGIELGFKGPNYSISTACATSNYSLLAAKRHIEYGECDVMVTGGVEAAMNAAAYGGFSALRALSRSYENPSTASRPFDKNRDGFVMGEGAAVFVLESEEHALARGAKIYGTLSGGAINSDAYHMTNPKEDGSEVARCIKMALKDAELGLEDIDYINAHATSTPAGDLCEMRAIQAVFGNNKRLPKINSTKSMIGHGLGASGGLELAAILMAIASKKLHPTINVVDVEEEVGAFDILKDGSIDYEVKHAISNSFGFGGHNSVIVVSKY